MKKTILSIIIISITVFMFSGCSEQSGSTGKEEKFVRYEVKNLTSEDWVICHGGTKQMKDISGIAIQGLIVKAGASTRMTIVVGNEKIEQAIKEGRLKEMSKNTWECPTGITAGGVVPPGKEKGEVPAPFFRVQDITLTGTYDEYTVVEWNGSEFKQVK